MNASPQSPYTVTEGRTAVMTCTVTTANPSSEITWTWEKTGIPDVILHRNHVYTITNIQRQQAGTYICTATNSVGTSTPALVDVQVQCKHVRQCLMNAEMFKNVWLLILFEQKVNNEIHVSVATSFRKLIHSAETI